MRYQVGTQPVPLFHDGEQSNVTVTNDGPYTIYLDENGSVSSYQSLPVPPLASVPWQSHRPLWLRAAQDSSQVRVSRTDTAPTDVGNRQQILYSRPNFPPLTPNTGLIETSPYQTLHITYTSANSTAEPALLLDWYASDGETVIKSTRYMPALPSAVTRAMRITVPVEGAYVDVNGSGSNAFLTSMTVVGNTIALPTRMLTDWTQTNDRRPVDMNNSAVTIVSYGTEFCSFQWDISATQNLQMHALGKRLAVQLTFPSAPADTGTIALQEVYGGLRIGPEFSIVVGTLSYYNEYVVPVGHAYKLRVTNAVASPSVNVGLTWSD